MSGPVVGMLGFLATLVLIAFELPVGVAMGIAGVGGYALLNGIPATGFILGTAVFDSVSNYGLSVIPLFLMMGIFASRSGLVDRSVLLRERLRRPFARRPGHRLDRRLRRLRRHLRLVAGDRRHHHAGRAAGNAPLRL